MNSQTMDTKTQIINLLRSTGREGIENVINFLESSNFFTVKCHSHHKYTGGMADHALETLKIARMTAHGIPEDSIAWQLNKRFSKFVILLENSWN